MLSDIKKLIACQEVNQPSFTIAYLEPEFTGGEKEEGTIPEMKLKSKIKNLTTETYSVSASVSRSQKKDLERLGLDITKQLENPLYDEMEINEDKKIGSLIKELGKKNYRKRFTRIQRLINKWTSYEPKVKFKDHNDLIKIILEESNRIGKETRMGNGDFVIVSSELSSIILDNSYFTPSKINNTFKSSPYLNDGQIISRISVIRDLFFNYGSMWITIGKRNTVTEPGVHFFYMNPPDLIHTVEETTMDSRISLCKRLVIKEIGDFPESNYVHFELTTERFPFLSFMWNKIKNKIKRGS